MLCSANRRILRFPQLAPLLGHPNRSTIYRWEHERGFPRRVVISPRCVGWYEDEVEDWINRLPKDAAPRPSPNPRAGKASRHGATINAR